MKGLPGKGLTDIGSSVGKGKGKEKGKAKAPRDPHAKKIAAGLSLVARTPDGRDICFKYNSGTCTGGCGRVHCCRVKGCTHTGPACERPHTN